MEQAFIYSNRRDGEDAKPPDQRAADYLATISDDLSAIGGFSIDAVENAVTSGMVIAMKQVLPASPDMGGFLGAARTAATRPWEV